LSEVTPITVDTPIPLMLEAFKANTAWALLEQRIIRIRDLKLRDLMIDTPKHTEHWIEDPIHTFLRRSQTTGYIEGLNRILVSPDLLEREWKEAVKTANRQRAS
jgi:hypothetical protein